MTPHLSRMTWSDPPQRLLDEAEAADDSAVEKKADEPKAVSKTRILADGTYATETVYTSNAAAARLEQVRAATKPPLRALILGGDFFTGSVLAATLVKLVMRFAEIGADAQAVNSMRAEAILIMTSIVRVGQSKFAAVPIDEDSQERIMNCVETLAQLQSSKVMSDIFLRDSKAAFSRMVKSEEVSVLRYQERELTSPQKKALLKKDSESKADAIQADDLISFRQLSKKSALGDVDDVGLSPMVKWL